MKVTYNWLKDYVDIKLSAKKLADELTMTGLEVTSLEKRDNDWVLELEITPNRSDCLSVIGIAREVAAITNSKLKMPQATSHRPQATGLQPVSIKIEDKKACPLYTARVMRNVQVKPSPKWMQVRLEAVGIRPINNIVDITNYVLIETGQPLHAFDYDKLVSPSHEVKLIVRFAQRGEKLVAIDEIERKLDENSLIIAAGSGKQGRMSSPVAIAGIMGGKESEVSKKTRNILLESAYFDPIITRRVSRGTGLSSESSYRFERAVDIQGVMRASQRAARMIEKIAGGELGELGKLGKLGKRAKNISLRLSRVNEVLGLNISLPAIKQILNSLQFKATQYSKTNTSNLKIAVPSFRQDIKEEIDIIEEVARIYGYDKIASSLPAIKPKLIQSSNYKLTNLIREALINQGLNEVITYSLISRELLNKARLKVDPVRNTTLPKGRAKISNGVDNLMTIENPFSDRFQVLRPSLLPSLLTCLLYNLNHQNLDMRIFELSHIFIRGEEKTALGILLAGEKFSNWQDGSRDMSIFDLKGILELALKRLGVKDFRFLPQDLPTFSQGSSAILKAADKEVGVMGEVPLKAKEEFDLSERDIFYAQIILETLYPFIDLEKRFILLPIYPAILRDVSLIVPREVNFGQILEKLSTQRPKNLTSVKLIDVYQGKQIPKGFISLTLSLEYRSEERTLTDEEVNQQHNLLCQRLSQELGLKIRYK